MLFNIKLGPFSLALDMIPSDHPILKVEQLSALSGALFEQLLLILTSKTEYVNFFPC